MSLSGVRARIALMRRGTSLVGLLSALCLVGLSLTSVTSADASAPTGALTVAEVASEWPGLDPATGTEVSADYDYMNAIFGQLFVPGRHGAVLPGLATGYHFSKDGLTLTVSIRRGVTFQDGTPFTAKAVQYNLQRDSDPKNACACAAAFSDVKSVTTSGNDVVLHLSTPDYPLINTWVANSAQNWIASPTALAKEGVKEFSIHPVGAGPFEVGTNEVNSKLTLKAFPGYWQKGLPKLQTLIFLSVGEPDSAYDALQAGSSEIMASGLDTQILNEARKNAAINVVSIPGAGSNVVQLNTKVAPFDNKLAREAVYYATNSPAYLQVIGGGQGTLTQSPSGPGDLFFEPTVPGYRTYNLAKAKELVKQLGGLSFTYGIGNTSVAATAGAALQSMWQAAGMHVKLQLMTFPEIVEAYTHNTWQASAEVVGNVEPSIGTSGLASRFSSIGALSGVKNPALDKLLAKALRTPALAQRKSIYSKMFKIISDQAYAPLLYVASGNLLTTKSVTGVAPVFMASFGPMIEWQDVGLSA